MIQNLALVINQAFDDLKNNNLPISYEVKLAVEEALHLLNIGTISVAYKENNEWKVNEWVKKAILLSFKIFENKKLPYFSEHYSNYDKIPLKNVDNFDFRSVPGAIVRHSAFIDTGAILMPSFINVGARVGKNTMIDTWSTVGSCAYVGDNCHISGGVGIGGVLEPLNARPVIIEDNCFIGARSEIAEGVIVKEGSVISMGVYIGSSTKIINRQTGEISFGVIPPYSVVVGGTYNTNEHVSLNAAIIIKTVDEKTRSKTSLNELLRD
jgi:2,3,4,5-tetrahydropyridine-2-carboxylate N-succinyltransferase